MPSVLNTWNSNPVLANLPCLTICVLGFSIQNSISKNSKRPQGRLSQANVPLLRYSLVPVSVPWQKHYCPTQVFLTKPCFSKEEIWQSHQAPTILYFCAPTVVCSRAGGKLVIILENDSRQRQNPRARLDPGLQGCRRTREQLSLHLESWKAKTLCIQMTRLPTNMHVGRAASR